MKINKDLSNDILDVWSCECGTDTPLKKGSPQPVCEYCRRVKEHSPSSEDGGLE